MQQGVQTDATCNIQQCWELLVNNVASVCTQPYSAGSSASAASVPYLQPRLRNPGNFVLSTYKNIPVDFTQGTVYMIPD